MAIGNRGERAIHQISITNPVLRPQPVVDEKVPFGHRYQQTETIAADGQVSLLENPAATLAIASMLPG